MVAPRGLEGQEEKNEENEKEEEEKRGGSPSRTCLLMAAGAALSRRRELFGASVFAVLGRRGLFGGGWRWRRLHLPPNESSRGTTAPLSGVY